MEHDACGVGFVATTTGVPSHEIVQLALESLARLSHRGAIDADGKTGDGAGILTQIPRKLLAREVERLGGGSVDPNDLAVGMVFLPRKLANRVRARSIVERVAAAQGIPWLGWRPVPVDAEALGDKAKSTRPEIAQAILRRPDGMDSVEFERRLYLMRKAVERAAAEDGLRDLYVPSLSSRTVVYKGLFHAPQLAAFYEDLRDPDFEATLALFHQRYSTNTFPNWALAQPFRMLAHNGEINTLLGNRNWMKARESELRSPAWGDQIETLRPVVWADGSDSASLYNVLELHEMTGLDDVHSLMMLVPEAW
jgi:glutamate synthase (NADPH/NADH) large chain/glutamate synthase (ferredoxin)